MEAAPGSTRSTSVVSRVRRLMMLRVAVGHGYVVNTAGPCAKSTWLAAAVATSHLLAACSSGPALHQLCC